MDARNDRFSIVEWFIENFTFYTEEVHGECIISCDTYLQLYPKDSQSGSEQLSVLVHNNSRPSYLKLSIIGSDGSILYDQEVNNPIWTIWNEFINTTKFFTGLKFKDVANKTRMNKHFFKDILTIRCSMKNSDLEYISTHSIISISVACFKLFPDFLKTISCKSFEHIASIEGYVGEHLTKKRLLACLDSHNLEDAEIIFKLKLCSKHTIAIRTCICRLNSDETVIQTDNNARVLKDKEEWVFSDMLKRKEIIEKSQTLALRFVVIYGTIDDNFSLVSEGEGISTKIANKSTNSSFISLSEDLEVLYKNPDFSDFQVLSWDKSFATHKSILSARSSFFKSLFSSGGEEAVTGRLDIKHLDHPTVDQMLRFLYCGTIDLQWKNAMEVYRAANKYQIDSLKKTCVEYFTARVATWNVCEILSWADEHQDDELKSVAQAFILKNYDEVIRSGEWNFFMDNNPKLLARTLTCFSVKGLIGRIRRLK